MHDGVLTHAGMVRGNAAFSTSERVVDIADRLRDAVPLCDVLYVECMRYRPQAKVNPAILLALNLLAGSAIRLAKPSAEVHFVEPGTWKGQLEKTVHGSRIRLTLSPHERNIVDTLKPKSLVNNVVDAVGLCLFATDRLTPKTRTLRRFP